MMPHAPVTREIAHLVERQLQNWELARAQRFDLRPAQQVHDFVTLSRQVGAGGVELARRLGVELGWPVFDREILQYMADDDELRARLYEKLDERDMTWLEEVFHVLLRGVTTPHDYCKKLTRTILTLARKGPAIFLGRGADLLLPADHGLRVGLVAPLEQRVARIARQFDLDPDAAAQRLRTMEHERRVFYERHFHQRWDDPLRFDMVLNTARVPPEACVKIIREALRQRGVHV